MNEQLLLTDILIGILFCFVVWVLITMYQVLEHLKRVLDFLVELEKLIRQRQSIFQSAIPPKNTRVLAPNPYDDLYYQRPYDVFHYRLKMEDIEKKLEKGENDDNDRPENL